MGEFEVEDGEGGECGGGNLEDVCVMGGKVFFC